MRQGLHLPCEKPGPWRTPDAWAIVSVPGRTPGAREWSVKTRMPTHVERDGRTRCRALAPPTRRGSKRTAWLALSVALAAPVGAQSLPSYLQLDGRWYPVGDGTITFVPDVRALVVDDTVAQNCRRASGAPVAPSGTVLYYGPTLTSLQIVPPLHFHYTGYRAAVAWTAQRDVVCDGEVAAPIVSSPERIFRDTFEPSDALLR